MAKQLFNSSENSNFILNMTEEGYSKVAAAGLLTACFATSAVTAYPVLTKSPAHNIASIGLAVAGVFCMIVTLIGVIKKFYNKQAAVPMIGMVGMLVMGLLSMAFSYDISIGFYGYPGRDEGALALMFYVCFFMAGSMLKTRRSVTALLYGVVGLGILNGAFGMVQVFTGRFNFFHVIAYGVKADAASGFAQSPIFLAMLLTLSLTAALIGFITLENKKGRIVCIIGACVMSFSMFMTYSLTGIVGAAIAVVAAVVTVLVMKAPKLRLLAVLAVIIPAAGAILFVNGGNAGDMTEYRLQDGNILWNADSYMRLSASGMPGDNMDINSTTDVYYTLNRKTMDIISGAPILGTGPDQLFYPQLYTYGEACDENSPIADVVTVNKGVFDRVYNEYLNVAGTRGIPSAVMLAAVLGSSIFIGIRSFKKRRDAQSFCVLVLTAAGALIFLVCCGNTAFSPVFWAICGCTCADIPKEVVRTANKVKAKKAETPKEPAAEEKPAEK